MFLPHCVTTHKLDAGEALEKSSVGASTGGGLRRGGGFLWDHIRGASKEELPCLIHEGTVTRHTSQVGG